MKRIDKGNRIVFKHQIMDDIVIHKSDFESEDQLENLYKIKYRLEKRKY